MKIPFSRFRLDMPAGVLFNLFVLLFAVTPALADAKTVLVFGDSLVAGYGLPKEQAFPAQLQAALTKAGHEVKIIDAGVSGDTASGGANRLVWTLQQKPADYAIIVLGGNDMLRGVDPKITEASLTKIMETLRDRKIPVLLAGMKSFRNLGAVFGRAYDRIYKELSEDYDAVFYPFFLDGVALESKYNQDDGVHPNAAGVALIVEKIMPSVEALLKKEKPQ